MQFKETQKWEHYPGYMTDSQAAAMVGHLLWTSSKWEKLTLYFDYTAEKEHLVFEGFELKYAFLRQARDVDLQELNYIVLEKKGLKAEFIHYHDHGWELAISDN